MVESFENGDISDQVEKWVNSNDRKLKALKRVVKYEENNSCHDCPFSDKEEHGEVCWNPSRDISVPPSYVGHLKSAPFIGVVYNSNNHTDLSLKSLEEVKMAVKELEGQPEEFSEDWVNEKVRQSSNSIDDVLDSIEITESEKEKIEKICERNEALNFWKDRIAPGVKHREKAKKAILIMLASPEDAHGNRGRINVKIYGPPGTGKSSIKKYLKKEFEALTIDGARVSKADLTFNKSTSELGKLPKAHKGILVVEEADEMGNEELGSTLTSLGESGEIEIRDMEIPAEARGVMLSNFETKREIINSWSPESLNRFDFIIKFDLLDDSEKNDTLDWHYEHFRQPKPDERENILKKYIKLAREFYPKIEEDEDIKEFANENIDKIQNVREGISIMNVAWTIARLNFENVKLEHYKKAFDLISSDERVISKKYRRH